jgi:glucose-6-phosphate 1-epimerase
MNFEQLRQYEIEDQLQFVEIEHGFTYIEINNARAHATISTYSAQVLSYLPKGQQNDLLFVSDKAFYENGKAIKGGIPVCWPWFGPDPDGQGRPAHGFVRNRLWQVSGTGLLADGSTKVVMSLADSDETRRLWPHPFRLDLEITVGDSLRIELVTRNTGDQRFTISQALHTYFRVGDIRTVRVLGLEGLDYIDKVDNACHKTQSGPLVFESEVDRIYTGVAGELVIDDASLNRRIRIRSAGSSTAVVWNPWAAAAAAMADLDADDYRRMLCVETANAGPETLDIAPGGEYRLQADYILEN